MICQSVDLAVINEKQIDDKVDRIRKKNKKNIVQINTMR